MIMGREGENESNVGAVDLSDAILRERHLLFVEELDNIPMERLHEEGMMSQLAATLGWTLEEVEAHAYQYFVALMEVSDEDYDSTKSRERVQTDFLNKKLRTRGYSRGIWTSAETRLLQTLMATLEVEYQKNLVERLARFFPDRRPEQIQNQVYFLQQRRRLSEAVDTT